MKSDILTVVKPLIVQNLSSFIVYSTDNVIISMFINSYSVGLYSNYCLIINTIQTMFS